MAPNGHSAVAARPKSAITRNHPDIPPPPCADRSECTRPCTRITARVPLRPLSLTAIKKNDVQPDTLRSPLGAGEPEACPGELLKGLCHEEATAFSADRPSPHRAARAAPRLRACRIMTVPVSSSTPSQMPRSAPCWGPLRCAGPGARRPPLLCAAVFLNRELGDADAAPADARRCTLFWAESPRRGARTYFIHRRHAVMLSRPSKQRCGSRETQQVSGARCRCGQPGQPHSRCPLPAAVLKGSRALVFDGDPTGWDRLTVFGQSTVCARVLGNTAAASRCVRHTLSVLSDAAHIETWERPIIVLADDAAFFHGRLGARETGGAFFRVWLSGPPTSSLRDVSERLSA